MTETPYTRLKVSVAFKLFKICYGREVTQWGFKLLSATSIYYTVSILTCKIDTEKLKTHCSLHFSVHVLLPSLFLFPTFFDFLQNLLH